MCLLSLSSHTFSSKKIVTTNVSLFQTTHLYILLVINIFLVPYVKASGAFELEMLKYEHNNLTAERVLAAPAFAAPVISLPEYQEPYLVYNLCLKEANARVLGAPCTFGQLSSSPASLAVPVLMQMPFTFRWMKSITLIISISRLDERRDGLQLIDKHVHFDEHLLPSNVSSENAFSWNYRTFKTLSSRLVYRFRVRCSDNYFGDDCSVFCRARDDAYGHFRCDHMGIKVCLAGWRGINCDRPICREGCSDSHGHCTRPGQCDCKPGYSGPYCDQCIKHPGCVHGHCVRPFECVCDRHWGGVLCDQDLNFCGTHEPCVNGGLCENIAPNQYRCRCPAGFTGINCETVLDACMTNPCLNGGSCLKLNGSSFTCSCPTGWTGKRCEMNVNECAIAPCKNGGRCVDTLDGFQCECKAGFTGNTCDQDIDECSLDADGTCVAQNTRRCLNKFGSFQCECLPGFTGQHCELNVDDCTASTCANHGTCIDLANDYQCICRRGFRGRNCTELDHGLCTRSDLKNMQDMDLLSIDSSASEKNSNNSSGHFWEVVGDSNTCDIRWCTCSTEQRLRCACVRREAFARINREQLQRLLLQKSPLLTNALEDNNLRSVPAALQRLSTKTLELPESNDDLLHVAIRFERLLNQSQIASACSALSAIFSLLCEQPELIKLHAACGWRDTTRELLFYSLDNDERVLLIGDILRQSYTDARILQVRVHSISSQNNRIDFHAFLCWFTISLVVGTLLTLLVLVGFYSHRFEQHEKKPVTGAQFVRNDLRSTLRAATSLGFAKPLWRNTAIEKPIEQLRNQCNGQMQQVLKLNISDEKMSNIEKMQNKLNYKNCV